LLYFAALDPRAKSIEAWDVSDASLNMTTPYYASALSGPLICAAGMS
jgi:hypothetical protein